MTTEKAKDLNPRELWELKEAASKYYKENGIPERMEEVLNSMFFANPDDVYGHVSEFFAAHSKSPTISKVCSREALDSKGEPALQVDVMLTVKNYEKLLSSATIGNNPRLPDLWKIEEKEAEDVRRLESITAAISYISEQISEKLKGIDPCQQCEVDTILCSFIDDLCQERDEKTARDTENGVTPAPVTPTPQDVKTKPAKSPKGKKSAAVVVIPDPKPEVMLPGCELVSAVSMAACESAANVYETSLYSHIRKFRYLQASGEKEVSEEDHKIKQLQLEESEKLRMPLPVITILQGGKSSPGKQNCVKEYMVTSCPGKTFSEGLEKLRNIRNTVFKTLFVKAGATLRNLSDQGAVCPVLDRVEQGLDIIQDAAIQLELTAGVDFNIILHLNGRDIFDYEKGKYEVVIGQFKVGEELADFYGDICNRYPSVIGLIDPIRPIEQDAWMKICDKVSEKVYVFGEDAWPRPGVLKHEEMSEYFKTSGVVFKYDQMTTVTDLVECCQLMRDNENRIMISTSSGETSDTYLADLAVGLGADFIKVGGFNRGERVNKLNRLLQIEQEVTSQDRLESWPEHLFTKIDIPPPPVTPTSVSVGETKDSKGT